jgi:sec-independent protein translocase protein TatC
VSQQTAPPQSAVDESRMTLMDHLRELRTRLIWIVGSLLIGTLIAMLFSEAIVRFIIGPLSVSGTVPLVIDPTAPIGIFFQVSLTTGAIIALPIILYQIIAFMAPGLYPNEKRAVLFILPGAMVLFGIGAAFAYFMLVPVAVGFLQGFWSGLIRADWTLDLYLSFVMRLVFWIGLSFEMPLLISFFARIGLVSGQAMLGFWRQAVVIIALVAAAITPTVDPVNMSLVMLPLGVLYAASTALAYLLYKPRTPRDFSQEDFLPPEFKE